MERKYLSDELTGEIVTGLDNGIHLIGGKNE